MGSCNVHKVAPWPEVMFHVLPAIEMDTPGGAAGHLKLTAACCSMGIVWASGYWKMWGHKHCTGRVCPQWTTRTQSGPEVDHVEMKWKWAGWEEPDEWPETSYDVTVKEDNLLLVMSWHLSCVHARTHACMQGGCPVCRCYGKGCHNYYSGT